MPTRDPEKNRAYVADYRRRMKENAELKKIYDSANLGYINKFNEKLKNEIGKEQYNEDKTEYMRNYRAKQKQAKKEIQNSKATMLQSAIRNKLARKAMMQQKLENDKKALYHKFSVNMIADDILNDLFSNIQIKRKRGRPPKKQI